MSNPIPSRDLDYRNLPFDRLEEDHIGAWEIVASLALMLVIAPIMFGLWLIFGE